MAALHFGREATYIALQFPLGAAIAGYLERFCQRKHSFAVLCCVVKFVCVYILASLLFIGYTSESGLLFKYFISEGPCDTKVIVGIFLGLGIRFTLLALGVIIGTAFQPVGLTGGIATGKSTVSNLLAIPHEENRVEINIINVDGIAHDILSPMKMGQDSVYHRLIFEFGSEILQEKSDEKDLTHSTFPCIDRRKLGTLVFQDKVKRRKLNSITHPKIIKIMLKRIFYEAVTLNLFDRKSKPRQIICVDIPLLFEGGIMMRFLFGIIIVVTCNPENQLSRLHDRNPHLTLEECRLRIAAQIPMEEKTRNAHIVLLNDGNIQDLERQVSHMKEWLANAISPPQRGVELSCIILSFGGISMCIHTLPTELFSLCLIYLAAITSLLILFPASSTLIPR